MKKVLSVYVVAVGGITGKTEVTVTSVIQVLEQILLHGVLMKCPYQ
jgi:hypothetical protein